MRETRRQQAIRSGVANAAQTVFDGDMTLEAVHRGLQEFVEDGLNCAGFGDSATEDDMRYARMLFPL